jgi:hypothetical protein
MSENEPETPEPETPEPETPEPETGAPGEPKDLGPPVAPDFGPIIGPFRSTITAFDPSRRRRLFPRILTPTAGRKRFDLTRSRERTRGALAVWSMALFTVMVLALTLPVVFGLRKWEDLQGLATSVLPVVVSVVGTITGFYFGIKAATEDGEKGGSDPKQDHVDSDEEH